MTRYRNSSMESSRGGMRTGMSASHVNTAVLTDAALRAASVFAALLAGLAVLLLGAAHQLLGLLPIIGLVIIITGIIIVSVILLPAAVLAAAPGVRCAGFRISRT